jgi:hypothetical protein
MLDCIRADVQPKAEARAIQRSIVVVAVKDGVDLMIVF